MFSLIMQSVPSRESLALREIKVLRNPNISEKKFIDFNGIKGGIF